MKKSILKVSALLAVMALAFTSCNTAPQAEIDAALAAIDSAKVAGAELYAPVELTQAMDTLNVAMQGVEEQKSKLFGNYDATLVQLDFVKTTALASASHAVVRKEEIKVEIAQLIDTTTVLLAENKTLVASAPKGKEGASALEAIQNDINVIEASLTEATTQFQAGVLIPTIDQVKAANEKAVAVNTELKTVAEKYSKGKKK